jgi:hypothetical protein
VELIGSFSSETSVSTEVSEVLDQDFPRYSKIEQLPNASESI